MHKPPRRSAFELVTINFFWLGLNIRNNAVGAIFMPYLVERFVRPEIRNTALGELRTVGLIVALLAQPLMGLLSDRSRSRFGRRRPFIFSGVLLDLVFLAAMTLVTGFWQLAAVVLLIQVSSNISHGPLQGLIPDLVPEGQRGTASAVKAIFELLPLILVGIAISPLVGAGRFGQAVGLTGGLLLLAMLVTVLLVREGTQRGEESHPAQTPVGAAMLRVVGMLGGLGVGALAGLLVGGLAGGLVGLLVRLLLGERYALTAGVAVGGVTAMAAATAAGVWAGLRATLGQALRSRPAFGWWVVNRLLFLAAVTSLQGFAPFFFQYTFAISAEAAAARTGSLMTMVGLFTLASALPAGWLSDRFGQRRLTGLSGLVAAFGTGLLLLTIWEPDERLIYLAGTVLGLATGLFTTTNWALGTRLAPQEEAGRYLGASNLAGAGAGMVGAGIGGPVADVLNRSFPGLGYFVIFAGYALLFGLSALALRGVPDGEPGS